MSLSVSINAVAKAAGVDKSTVSRVLSGKAAQGRICPTTQEKIRTVARQLGYTANPNTRFTMTAPQLVPAAPSPAPIRALESQTPARQIGLVLSPNSPASVLALIPGLDPVLADAGYRLVVMTLPGDSTAGRDRVTQLIHDSAGILCCPSIFPAVSVAVANQCPVIALSPGAAKSMVDKISGCPVVGDGEVAELPIVELLREESVVVTPVPPPVVAVHEPFIPVVAPVELVVAVSAVAGGEVAELPVVELVREEPITEPSPVVTPDPVVAETPIPPPVAVTEPVVVEAPIPPPVVAVPEPVIPVVAPVEPVVVVPEVTGGEVAELPVVELLREEPVAESPPVVTSDPIVVPVIPVVAPVEPVVVTEPVVVEAPISSPVVAEPEPVIPVVAPVEPIVEVPEVAVGEVAELPVVESLREEPVAESPPESPIATPSEDPV